MKNNCIYILLNLIMISIVSYIKILPWWGFLIVTFLMGFYFSFKKIEIKPFLIGFISGFLNWTLALLFFHFMNNGELLNKVAEILLISKYLLIPGIGIIAGILNALASFSGYAVFTKKDDLVI